MTTPIRSVGWSIGRSACRSVVQSVGRSAGQSVGRSVGWSVGLSVGRLVGWSVGRSAGRPIGQPVGRAAVSLSDKFEKHIFWRALSKNKNLRADPSSFVVGSMALHLFSRTATIAIVGERPDIDPRRAVENSKERVEVSLKVVIGLVPRTDVLAYSITLSL